VAGPRLLSALGARVEREKSIGLALSAGPETLVARVEDVIEKRAAAERRVRVSARNPDRFREIPSTLRVDSSNERIF